MNLFKVEKTPDYHIYHIFGFEFKRLRSKAKKTSVMYKNLKKTKLKTDGFSLVGSFNENSGEAEVGRAIIEAMKMSDIPFEVLDIYGKQLPIYKHKISFTTGKHFKPVEYNNISQLVWEFESGMDEVRPYVLQGINGILTFSSFCANFFKPRCGDKIKIFKLHYPMHVDRSALEAPESVREKYGLAQDDFVVFFNFSFMSSYFRKNPEAVVDAFKMAVGDKDKVKLVFKTSGAKKAPELVERLKNKIESLGLTDKVVFVEQFLATNEMRSLINCCDVYMSLHRGEGFGLGMLEAMLLAKPVIATNYSGNVDFTRPECSLLVDYKMVKPEQHDLEVYKYVQLWADANVETAANHLKDLYDHPEKRAEIGKKALDFALEFTDQDKFVEDMKGMLATLNQMAE